jgi:hypothetical protein
MGVDYKPVAGWGIEVDKSLESIIDKKFLEIKTVDPSEYYQIEEKLEKLGFTDVQEAGSYCYTGDDSDRFIYIFAELKETAEEMVKSCANLEIKLAQIFGVKHKCKFVCDLYIW